MKPYRAAAAAVVILALSLLDCHGGDAPASAASPTPQAPSAGPMAPATDPIQFIEYSYASTYTTQGRYTLRLAQPGDLMLFYLTDMNDFQMPAGWTPIGDVIVLHQWGQYPVKGFFRFRQAGDPTTYTIAQTTGFLAVYRNVDPDQPIDSFVHAQSESQTPPIGNLFAPADGAASVYFFIGLYHSDILAPDGYDEIYGCRRWDGTSHDTGMGHRLGLSAGAPSGGNIFIAYPDCQRPGEAPYKEAIMHVMLTPAGGSAGGDPRPTGLRIVADATRP